MTLWRSGLLALTISAGLVGGANLAAADGPGGGWPNIPWTWSGMYGGVSLGSDDDNFLFGVQLGRNWHSGSMVYGIEGDITFSDQDNVDFFGTIRGRWGYLLSPSILAYGTAGLGFVDDGGNGKGKGNGKGNDGSDAEFVYGFGIEGKVTTTTTLGLEFLNFDDSNTDIVRARLNFRF